MLRSFSRGSWGRWRRCCQSPPPGAQTAVAIGIAGGSYGIASAASGNGSSFSSSAATTTQPAASSQPWCGQRSDETLLTGDAESKVRAAALAEVSGGTIIRVETDADGNAAYEAHMTRSDGTPVTVFQVVQGGQRREPVTETHDRQARRKRRRA